MSCAPLATIVGGLCLDRGRDFGRPAIVEGAVAIVDHGERLEGIETEGILRVAVEDRRGAADRLRSEPAAGPVRGRGVEGNPPDHSVGAGQVTGIAPPHEGQRAAIGRFVTAALQIAEKGIVGRPGMDRIGHGNSGILLIVGGRFR